MSRKKPHKVPQDQGRDHEYRVTSHRSGLLIVLAMFAIVNSFGFGASAGIAGSPSGANPIELFVMTVFGSSLIFCLGCIFKICLNLYFEQSPASHRKA